MNKKSLYIETKVEWVRHKQMTNVEVLIVSPPNNYLALGLIRRYSKNQFLANAFLLGKGKQKYFPGEGFIKSAELAKSMVEKFLKVKVR